MSAADRAEVDRYVPDVLSSNKKGTDVVALQRFLRSKGYNLTVDGKLGPLTKSAILDWHRGVGRRNPQAWTRENVKIDDPHRSNSGASKNNQINQPADSSKTPYRKDDSQPAAGKRTTTNVGTGGGLLSNNAINPKVLAQSMVDAKYGPILGEIMRQEKNLRTQGSVNLTDIENWYGQLDTNVAQRNKEAADFDAANLAAIEGVAPSAAGALGIAPGSEAATTVAAGSDIAADMQRTINQTQGDFASNLRNLFQAGGVAAKTNEQTRQTQALDELFGQRRDILAAKGSDFQSAYADALQLNQGMQSEALKNRLAIFNAQMAAQLAPLQLQSAGLDVEGQGLANIYKQLQIDNLINPKPKPKTPVARNFVDLTPEERYQLAGDITGGAEGMRANLDPNKNNSAALVRFINNRLRMAGYKPGANRQVGRFAFDIAQGLGINASPKWWGLGR